MQYIESKNQVNYLKAGKNQERISMLMKIDQQKFYELKQRLQKKENIENSLCSHFSETYENETLIEILKTTRVKRTHCFRRNTLLLRLVSDCSTRRMKTWRQWNAVFNVLKANDHQLLILYPVKYLLKVKGKQNKNIFKTNFDQIKTEKKKKISCTYI